MTTAKVIEGAEAQSILLAASGDEASQQSIRRKLDAYREPIQLILKNVNFAAFRAQSKNGELNFRRLNFGNRTYVDFSGANFGDGDVSFEHSDFHQGVSFKEARFGAGTVSFNRTRFKDADFSDSVFEWTEKLSFNGSYFSGKTVLAIAELRARILEFSYLPGQGSIPDTETRIVGRSFTLKVGKSSVQSVTFSRTALEAQDISLDFGGFESLEKLDFSECTWSGCNVSIDGLSLNGDQAELLFSSQNLSRATGFRVSRFSMPQGGSAHFCHTIFPDEGLTHFQLDELGAGVLDFHGSSFGRGAHFAQSETSTWSIQVDFRGATFAGPLDISGLRFGPVPDFTGTEFRKHLSLHGISYKYERTARVWSRDPDPENAAYLQRLKELAEDNRDHQLALTCHADEMRSRRWQRRGFRSKAADVLDLLFDATSNYGQSIARPICLLALSWFVFAGLYGHITPGSDALRYLDFLPYAVAMSFPFLPASVLLRQTEFAVLFRNSEITDPSTLFIWMGVQGVVSIMLLFLIGLGLRNRFRI